MGWKNLIFRIISNRRVGKNYLDLVVFFSVFLSMFFMEMVGRGGYFLG